jgi:hypothetical protein
MCVARACRGRCAWVWPMMEHGIRRGWPLWDVAVFSNASPYCSWAPPAATACTSGVVARVNCCRRMGGLPVKPMHASHLQSMGAVAKNWVKLCELTPHSEAPPCGVLGRFFVFQILHEFFVQLMYCNTCIKCPYLSTLASEVHFFLLTPCEMYTYRELACSFGS